MSRTSKITNTISTVISLTILAIAALICGYVFYVQGLFINEPAGVIWLSVLYILIGLVLHACVGTVWHELGHLIFGLMAKFRFYAMSFGPLCLTRSGKGIRIAIRRNAYYGACIMVPKTTQHFFGRTAFKVFGGGVFTLMLAVACWLLLFLANFLPSPIYTILAVGAITHTYVLFREWLPCSNQMMENDGAQMIGVLSRTPQVIVNLKLFTIQCMFMQGISPKDVPNDLLFQMPVMPDNSDARLLTEDYRYLYHLDRGELEQALACTDFIRMYVDELADIYRVPLLTDIFFNLVHYRNDCTLAEQMYPDIEKFLNQDHNITNCRIQMAYELYLQKNYKKAVAVGKEGLAIAHRFILPGVVPLEQKLIGEMMEIAIQHRGTEENQPQNIAFTAYVDPNV